MNFLCDEMLQGLGRWLRAAGYDTAIERDGAPDRTLIQRSVREERLLITRDGKLLEHRNAARRVVLLRGNGLEDCARELTERLTLNWLYRPFSRCLLCNAVLSPAPPERWDEVPPLSRFAPSRPTQCPQCDRLYWEGGHVHRMRAHLSAWQHLAGHASR